MSSNVIHLYTIDLDPPAYAVNDCLHALDELEAARAARFVRKRDRRRWTVSRGSLRSILSRYCQSHAREIRFDFDVHGKPSLATTPDCPGLQFNLSHSHELALLAVTRAGPIGVDIEFLRDISNRDEIAKRVFSAMEQTAYLMIPDSVRTQAFFHGWTRKEAFVKATGDGLQADLGSFDVTLTPGKARVVSIDGSAAGAAAWQLFDFRPRPDYVGAIAIKSSRSLKLLSSTMRR